MFYKEIEEQARPGSAFLEHLEAQGILYMLLDRFEEGSILKGEGTTLG